MSHEWLEEKGCYPSGVPLVDSIFSTERFRCVTKLLVDRLLAAYHYQTAVKTEIRTFESEFVGAVMLVDCADYMFIESLHVRPKFRSKGFGAALLQQCIYGNHQKPFILRVDPFDEDRNGLTKEQLQTWYERYGFQAKDNHYIDGDDYLWLPA